MIPMQGSSRSNAFMKSTNVRAKELPLVVAAAGLRAIEPWSPELTARLAATLMFRTTRRPSPPAERALLAGGERFTVRSGGRSLAAWTFGDGPTVLLVHGWNGRGGQLGAFVPALLARGFRVVTFDAPGHGESSGHDSSILAIANAIDDVISATASLFAPLQGIIGHSLGGAAITYAMSRAIARPRASNERALREALPARRFALVAPPIDLRDFVAGFSRAARLNDGTRHRIEGRIEEQLAISIDELYGPSLAEELRAPALIVHDEDDREVPIRCGRLLAAAWPGAELVVTRGLGHHRILRDPRVVEDVVAFVTERDLRAPGTY